MTSVPTVRLSASGVPSATRRPREMMPTRSASSSASSRYWVVRKMVVPCCCVEAADLVPHRGPALGVEAGGGLVEEEDVGVVDQGGGQVEAALHPPRVGVDLAVDGGADVDQA